MRIWDIPADRLCRSHLLAEHRELHAIWSIILNEKRGYSRHPEVMRWRGKLGALWARHESQRLEMLRRGYNHRSPLQLTTVPRRHRGDVQDVLLEPVSSQNRRLKEKRCACDISILRSAQGKRAANHATSRQPTNARRANSSSMVDVCQRSVVRRWTY